MIKLLSATVVAAVLLCASAAYGQCANCQPQPQGKPTTVIIQQPRFGFAGFRRRAWNRRYAPRAVAVQVQPVRWIPGRWEPVQ